jgi:phosphatidate cytidylyltransferase
MLKQRVITAVILLVILLPALFAFSIWPFALLTLVLIGAAGWEWARLNGVDGPRALGFGLLVAAGALVMVVAGWVAAAPSALWMVAVPLWVLGGAWVLRQGVSAWLRLPRGLRMWIGLMVLWLAWLAIASAKARGVNFLLSMLCLVWMADIAAYFGGKAFGRRKLAPAISPGKSWEGAFSGAVGVMFLAYAWMAFDRHVGADSASLYTSLHQAHGTLGLIAAVLFLTAWSVVGDLFESLIKRAAGAKDSSQLLPGHGGVLDRIDALLPVCPLALGLLA